MKGFKSVIAESCTLPLKNFRSLDVVAMDRMNYNAPGNVSLFHGIYLTCQSGKEPIEII